MRNIPTKIIQLATGLRKQLRAMPELSGHETETAARIASFAQKQGADEIITELGGHSIAVVIHGNGPGKNLILRADIDAIPTARGAAHLCGHDGHSAMLAGLIPVLVQQRPDSGNVILLFQSSEENGQGARALVDDPRFVALKPDLIVGMHNLPGFQAGSIVIKEGTFAMASHGLKVSLQGIASHAAEPEKGLNPAPALAEIVSAVDALARQISDEDSMITITCLRAGEYAFGSAAGEAELLMTLRAASDEKLNELNRKIVAIATSTAERHALKISIVKEDIFPATVNHGECLGLVESAAGKQQLHVIKLNKAFRWSEDFGHYGSLAPSAMFGLGAGRDCPALHSAEYEFCDRIIGYGMGMWLSLIATANGSN
ncbi:MAG TPA: amidohydrolase [Bacteroidales bacterium]|nr:amidohydrolase [Bacteroidales bacterium]